MIGKQKQQQQQKEKAQATMSDYRRFRIIECQMEEIVSYKTFF